MRATVEAAAPDTDVPEHLDSAAIEVLVGWKEDWAERPAAIASISGRTHPRLVQTLADTLGSVGRLPHIGAIVHDGPPRPAARTNSAQRLAQLWDTLSLERGLVDALAGDFAGRPILLIDDVMDSGWTLTLAARLLRQAGAAVYPLTLGIAGYSAAGPSALTGEHAEFGQQPVPQLVEGLPTTRRGRGRSTVRSSEIRESVRTSTRSARMMASSTSWVTSSTPGWWREHSSATRLCMRRRVRASSTAKGSSRRRS